MNEEMNDKQYEKYLLKRLITKFKREIFEKTGHNATVLISDVLTKRPRVSLAMMTSFFNKVMGDYCSKNTYNSITQKSRTTEINNLRKVYSKIAYDLGYKYVEIARELYPSSHEHSNVIYNINKFNGWVETEEAFRDLYNTIKTRMINDLRLNEPSDEEQSDPEPVLCNGMLSGQRSAIWSEYLPGVEAVEES